MLTKYILFGLLFLTLAESSTKSDAAERYRRLLRHYQNVLKKQKRFATSHGRHSWLCMRGGKQAICGGNPQQQEPAKLTSRSALKHEAPSKTKQYGSKCSSSTCQNGNCISGKCRCQSGWIGRQCTVDINECKRLERPCSQICLNTPGSYRCSCRSEYYLHHDGKHCVARRVRNKRRQLVGISGRTRSPLSRRRYSRRNSNNMDISFSRMRSYYPSASRLYYRGTKSNTCQKPCSYKCVNERGVYKCICPKGFLLAGNEMSCIDHNECLDVGAFECPINQQCVNMYGGYKCKCNTGYYMSHTLEGKSCVDLNECLSGDHHCDANARCINTIGSYACDCLPGFLKSLNNGCVPVGSKQTGRGNGVFQSRFHRRLGSSSAPPETIQ